MEIDNCPIKMIESPILCSGYLPFVNVEAGSDSSMVGFSSYCLSSLSQESLLVVLVLRTVSYDLRQNWRGRKAELYIDVKN